MTADARQTLELLHSLRTIHGNFSDKPVAEEHLRLIIEAAVRGANSSSRQSYSIISLSDKAVMNKVCGFSAPAALVFLSDLTRFCDVANALGYPGEERSLSGLLTATVDASLAAQNAVIAAKALGIDSLLTNGVLRGDPQRFTELLNLPQENCVPLFVVLFGYPDKEPEAHHGRYLGPGLLHKEHYQRMSEEELKAMTQAYDDAQQHLGLGVDWRSMGMKSYFQWYFEKWRGVVNKKPSAVDCGRVLAEKAGYLQ